MCSKVITIWKVFFILGRHSRGREGPRERWDKVHLKRKCVLATTDKTLKMRCSSLLVNKLGVQIEVLLCYNHLHLSHEFRCLTLNKSLFSFYTFFIIIIIWGGEDCGVWKSPTKTAGYYLLLKTEKINQSDVSVLLCTREIDSENFLCTVIFLYFNLLIFKDSHIKRIINRRKVNIGVFFDLIFIFNWVSELFSK